MKRFALLISVLLAGCISFGQSAVSKELTFLHTSGQDIVNASGERIFLKGVGLGNWLLPEGYMWKFGGLGDRPRKIEKLVADMIGKDQSELFWKKFRQQYITEADIIQIAGLGFNSVRPALNSRLFLTEGENPVYVEEGFRLIDSLVTWCKKHKLYVILDMHGAPGGQTGQNIDDSPNDIPELFINPKYQDQLVELWVKLAQRYKDEPTVAAYDLLNEPLPVGTGSADKYKHLLVPLYQRITTAIRQVDAKHMITLEGYDWANNWSVFDKPFDSNVFYQFHYYCWARPDQLGGIGKFLQKREELKTPVWVGETGEKGNAIYWATTQLFEANNIGFSFWPWKKMDTQNTPFSVKRPDDWDLISAYSKGGAKPDSARALKILNTLLENIKIENCDYFGDVCNAILTRIPGKIEAENYGQGGYKHSYFVLDTSKRSAYYRKDEPVQINLDSKDKSQFWSDQSIELKKSEWVVYDFDTRKNDKYHFSFNIAGADGPATVRVIVNNVQWDMKIGGEGWQQISAGDHALKIGKNKMKIVVISGVLKLDWIKLD